MLKILHLITSLNTGGAEMMLFKLLSNMDRSQFESCVVSMLDKGNLGDLLEQKGIRVYQLNMKRGIPSLSSIAALRKILGEEKPDIVQTWLYHADLLGTLVGKSTGVKRLVWNIRCSYMDLSQYSPMTKMVLKMLTFLSRRPDAVIVNSTQGQEVHGQLGYRPKRWVTLFNGFEPDRFKMADPEEKSALRKEFGFPEQTLLLGTVARYDPMKGYPVLMGAAKRVVANTSKQIRFVLVGKGVNDSNGELMKLISENGLSGYVTLLDERKDVPRILSMLDIYISPSIGEGFPNVIGEAMCCGVPCVATDTGESRRLVSDYGIVVQPGDPAALADGILAMLDKDNREALGAAGRRFIEENFHIRRIAEQYEALYKSFALDTSSED